MRWLKFLLSFALCLSTSFIVLFASSINSSAAVSGGDYLSNADALALFGQSISVRYYQNDGNTSGYVDATASYIGASSVQTMYSDTIFDSVYVGAPFLIYKCATPGINSNPSYITVKANPSFSVVDTDLLYTFIGCSATENTRPSSSFTSPSWNWSSGHYENSATDSNGHKSYFRASTDGDNYPYTFVPVELSTNASFSAYCQDANFYGNTNGGYGYTYIALGIPYISSSATVHPGTDIGGGSGGSSGTGDINVNVDMTETNGILSNVVNAITSLPTTIVNGISSIFVPEEGFLDEKLEDLQDHFAWYDDLKEAGDIFYTAFSANNFSDNPVVVIGSARSATTGGTYFSDGSFVLDMNDFAPYRSSVQTIISIFLWIMFFWRLYCRLPDIINGAGMIISTGSKIESWNAKENSFESGDAGADINSSIDHILEDL